MNRTTELLLNWLITMLGYVVVFVSASFLLLCIYTVVVSMKEGIF